MGLSQEQNLGRQEWRALAAGGSAGLILIVLVNIFPNFVSFTDVFASINIFLLICVLFSPFLLIYGFLDGPKRTAAVAVISYILSALLIGFMISYLARGDNYYSGLVMIPNEISWVVVAIIAILLIIPLINLFSFIPIAIWLGSLLYCKLYQASYFSKTVIGSPLFTVPLFVLLGCEIFRTVISRRSVAYIFDKRDGTLTQQRPPKGKAPVKKLLATVAAFLLLSSMIAAGFGVWNELEEANVSRISNFQLSTYTYYEGSYSYYLRVSFSLVNVRGKTIATEGTAELSIFNKNGTSILNRQFGFSQKYFTYEEAGKKWTCTRYISGQSLLSSIISQAKTAASLPCLVESINSGYATLKVNLSNGRKNLDSTTPIRYLLYSDMLMQFYFQSDTKLLQAELDKQWPFKASISKYFKMGDYAWMVVGRTGGEIIFYPAKIYNWYILQSTDGGCNWDITWRGDNYPTFNIEILNEKEVRIITPYATFITRDEGKTWEKLNSTS
jgi:hypothetical protein